MGLLVSTGNQNREMVSGVVPESRDEKSFCQKIPKKIFEAIAYIPLRLSECVAKKWLAQSLGSRLQADVQIDSYSFSMFGPQRLKGITIGNPKGELSIDQLQIDAPFYSLFSSSKKSFQVQNSSFSSPSYGNGKVERAAGVLSQEALTLSEPLQISLLPSSAIAIKNLNPLFFEGIQLQKPVSLTLSPKGFSYPLTPTPYETVQIEKAVLDLGQISCKPNRLITTLSQFLKSDRLLDLNQIAVHCAPFEFSAKNGLVQMSRMEALLAGSIHVSTWGSMDLLRDKIEMQAGIPSDMLEKWLGMENLSPDYVLPISISGSTENPQIDKTQAGIQLASLAANRLSGEGVFGKWVKNWIPASDAQNIPAAKRPFPWENH